MSLLFVNFALNYCKQLNHTICQSIHSDSLQKYFSSVKWTDAKTSKQTYEHVSYFRTVVILWIPGCHSCQYFTVYSAYYCSAVCAAHFALHIAKAAGQSRTIIFFFPFFFYVMNFLWLFCCRFSEIIDDLAHLVDKTDGRIRNETRRVKLVETKSASCGESCSIIRNKSRLSISWTNQLIPLHYSIKI